MGNAHHLFLVGDDAVRRGENLLEFGERIAHRLFAAFALAVHLVHAGIERAGAHQRAGGNEVVKTIRAHGPQNVGGERRFKLKDAGGAARAQGAISGLVVEREGLEVGHRVPTRANVLECVLKDGERGEAQEVHLEHARVLKRVHVELRHHHAFIVSSGSRGSLGLLRADGDVFVERAGRDHDAGRVHAGMT